MKRKVHHASNFFATFFCVRVRTNLKGICGSFAIISSQKAERLTRQIHTELPAFGEIEPRSLFFKVHSPSEYRANTVFKQFILGGTGHPNT
jgi:hypothetical protein